MNIINLTNMKKMINTLIDHNYKIYEEIVSKNIGLPVENKNKSYFTININENYYSIQSFKYKNKIMIDVIGKDNMENYKLLESFESVDSLIKYFEYKYALNNDYLDNDHLNQTNFLDDNNDIIDNDIIFSNIIENNLKYTFTSLSNYRSTENLID